MPTQQRKNLAKPWMARSLRYGKRYYLGHFATYDEAWDAEMEFARCYPTTNTVQRVKADDRGPARPHAARRYRGKHIYLGSFATAEEARAAEAAFDAEHPKAKPGPKSLYGRRGARW